MPAILANANSFLANTDYQLDKVIDLRTGTYSIAAATFSATITIPHGLGLTPLSDGYWSTDSTFALKYEFGAGTFPSAAVGSGIGLELRISSDATNYYIEINQADGLAATVHYRIFSLAQHDSNVSVPATSSSINGFLFNTDNNYMKLYMSNHLTYTGYSTQTIVHSLGYIPHVKAWYSKSSDGRTRPINFAEPFLLASNTWAEMEVTTSSIIVSTPITVSGRVDYRIYTDA